jgi:hypothetical protein
MMALLKYFPKFEHVEEHDDKVVSDRRVFNVHDLPSDIAEAIATSRMDPKHNHLNTRRRS